MHRKLLSLIIVFFLLFLLFIPSSTAFFNKKPIIRVAIIRQHWDPFDESPISLFSSLIHKHILKKGADHYGFRLRFFEFWDSWDHGDVQNEKLLWKQIDVAIAPGGVGGWFTPYKYRNELRKFVRRGGGFYGICGDSTFGSLGVKHMNVQYNSLITSLLGYNELSPMLGLVNVYTDASAIKSVITEPELFTYLDMMQFLTRLSISRARIHFHRTLPAIQEPYVGSSIQMMLGNAPLVSGPITNKFFLPRVITIASFLVPDAPYDEEIKYSKAIVASTYGMGRVVLSPVHAEFTIENGEAHDVYIRNVLWLSKELSLTNENT